MGKRGIKVLADSDRTGDGAAGPLAGEQTKRQRRSMVYDVCTISVDSGTWKLGGCRAVVIVRKPEGDKSGLGVKGVYLHKVIAAKVYEDSDLYIKYIEVAKEECVILNQPRQREAGISAGAALSVIRYMSKSTPHPETTDLEAIPDVSLKPEFDDAA